MEQIPSVPTLSVFFGRGNGCLKTVIVVQEDRTARPNGNIGSTTSVVAKMRPNSVLLVLRALRMQHTAPDLRPPPPPWTANPATPAQLHTHNRVEAMDSGSDSDNDFSMDPKPPQSDIDAGQTKVGNKDAAFPPRRVPSSISATCLLYTSPSPRD